MRNLNTRWILLVAVHLSVIVSAGWLAGASYWQHRALTQSQMMSFTVETLAQRTLQNPTAISTELQNLKARLPQEHRRAAVSALLEAQRKGNSLSQKIEFIAKTEQQYRRYIDDVLRFLERRLSYFCVIAALFLMLLLVSQYFFIQKIILTPLLYLSKRMTSFLNNRFTFEFEVPPQSDVGRLHATFNVLATTVLKNMAQLKALDQAKSDFLNIASHELRTPLTSIKGSLGLLRNALRKETGSPLLQLTNIAEIETDRLIRLINDFLDLAKIEAGRFPLHQNWYSLEDILQSTSVGLQGFAQKTKVQIAVECPHQILVYVDRDRIQQVLTNLLSNAIKFSPPESTVTLLADINDDYELQLKVIDQGKGIAPEDQEVIFERFRQATGPHNPLVKGTGLGLAIAKALIEQHRGEMGVNSKPGQGSTFYFNLPQWKYNEKAYQDPSPGGLAA